MLRLLAAAPLLLGGLLPLQPGMSARWPVAGRWCVPVGDARDEGRPGPDGSPGYSLTRSIGGPSRHQGADLSNRRPGGEVRAAAHGLVVAAGEGRPGNGYGVRVVIAHRLPDGGLVYSVYAHLAPGSVLVHAGDAVRMGAVIGRVGMTGDARSPHLHFEVRVPRVSSERWEKAATAEPIVFVRARLPTRDADSTWAQPYLVWAESAGLLDPDDDAEGPLRRDTWRRMLAAAAAPPAGPGPSSPGVSSDEYAGSAREPAVPLAWEEIAQDLARAQVAGLCLPRSPVDADRRRGDLRLHLGLKSIEPGATELGRRRSPPTIAEACLALFEVAGD